MPSLYRQQMIHQFFISKANFALYASACETRLLDQVMKYIDIDLLEDVRHSDIGNVAGCLARANMPSFSFLYFPTPQSWGQINSHESLDVSVYNYVNLYEPIDPVNIFDHWVHIFCDKTKGGVDGISRYHVNLRACTTSIAWVQKVVIQTRRIFSSIRLLGAGLSSELDWMTRVLNPAFSCSVNAELYWIIRRLRVASQKEFVCFGNAKYECMKTQEDMKGVFQFIRGSHPAKFTRL